MQNLKELISDIEKVTKLQADIANLSGIITFITDRDGNFISQPQYILEACRIIQDSSLGQDKCGKEFLKLIEEAKQAKAAVFSFCYAGLYKFAAPIISEGEFLGALIGCQIKPSDNPEFKDNLAAAARELGIEEKRLLGNTDNAAAVSAPQLKKITESFKNMINIFIRDQLELTDLKREIFNNYMEMLFLYEIGEIFGKGLDIKMSSQIILERLLELMDAERISLMLIDNQTRELKIIYAKGVPEEIIKNVRIKLGEGIAGFVAKEGKPILAENIEDNPEIKNLLIGDKGRFKTQSFISAPLICSPLKVENKIVGVINVTEKKAGKKFTQHDLNLLSAIGTQIAAVVENRRLFTDIKELFIATVRALSLALETKDTYTSGHSERVTECALAIAQELNMADKERADLELAGLLHDIGKIGISEEILLKPAKLTDKEFEEIKKHPLRGAEILEDIKQLSCIIPGILYHHERFDGKGYPQGLSKDEIPQIAKILAVADAFDAMTSERPYRAALSRDKAVDEIMRNAGLQFDPLITEAFLKTYQKGNI